MSPGCTVYDEARPSEAGGVVVADFVSTAGAGARTVFAE
jgi:hypothetical protein